LNIEKKIIEMPLGGTKEYYYDSDTPAEYRRIVGGVGWPSGGLPGFIVVVAEDYHPDLTLNLRHFRLLTEYSNHDMPKLVKRLYDFQNLYLVEPWHGEDDNEQMMHFVSKFNENLGHKKKGIYISAAPFIDDSHSLRFYAHQIKSLMSVAKKILHFGEASQLPGQLSMLSPDDVQTKQVQGYPAVAALGYAVAGLDEPYFEVSKHRKLQQQMIDNYNVAGM